MELIIFVGIQGAGKTTYYHANFAATHVHVSKDLMAGARSRTDKQTVMLHEALAAGRSVVVDNTNPTPAVRAPLIAIGRHYGARVIAIWFPVPVKTALARNSGREGKARVPNVAIFSTSKKIVQPTLDEGFDEIRQIAYT